MHCNYKTAIHFLPNLSREGGTAGAAICLKESSSHSNTPGSPFVTSLFSSAPFHWPFDWYEVQGLLSPVRHLFLIKIIKRSKHKIKPSN